MFDLTPFERGNRHIASFDPFREMEEFEKNFFGKSLPAFKTDIRENENEYILEADIPGFKKEDIHAEIKDDCLTIRAEHNEEKEDKDEKTKYIRRERSYGSYARSFDISGVEADKISATFTDGVLTLILPKKKEEVSASRSLEIK